MPASCASSTRWSNFRPARSGLIGMSLATAYTDEGRLALSLAGAYARGALPACRHCEQRLPAEGLTPGRGGRGHRQEPASFPTVPNRLPYCGTAARPPGLAARRPPAEFDSRGCSAGSRTGAGPTVPTTAFASCAPTCSSCSPTQTSSPRRSAPGRTPGDVSRQPRTGGARSRRARLVQRRRRRVAATASPRRAGVRPRSPAPLRSSSTQTVTDRLRRRSLRAARDSEMSRRADEELMRYAVDAVAGLAFGVDVPTPSSRSTTT